MTSDSRNQTIFLMSLVAGIIVLAGAVIQVNSMLSSVGVTSVFSALSLDSPDKVNFALYLTFPGASFAIVLWAGAEAFKGNCRRGGMVACLAVISGIVTLLLPFILGYPSYSIGFTVIALATILTAGVAYMGLKTPSVEAARMLTPIEIAVVAIFSALTAVLTSMTGAIFPSPTGGYTHIGDTAINVAALLFGVKVGGLVGIIGPLAADLLVGYPRWFVTVLAHGSQGFVAGLGKGRNTVIQAIFLIVSGFIMATSYFFVNIFIKGYPVAILSYIRDLFGQALVSIILGLILTKAAERALPSLLR